MTTSIGSSWCGGVVGVAPLLSASPESPNSSLCRSGRAHPPFRGTLFLLLVAMKAFFVLKKTKKQNKNLNGVIKTIKPRSADLRSLSTTMLCLFCQVFVSFGYFMLNICFTLQAILGRSARCRSSSPPCTLTVTHCKSSHHAGAPWWFVPSSPATSWQESLLCQATISQRRYTIVKPLQLIFFCISYLQWLLILVFRIGNEWSRNYLNSLYLCVFKSFFCFFFLSCLIHQVVLKMVNEIKKIPGISRVMYDLTSKPPGTTEWE